MNCADIVTWRFTHLENAVQLLCLTFFFSLFLCFSKQDFHLNITFPFLWQMSISSKANISLFWEERQFLCLAKTYTDFLRWKNYTVHCSDVTSFHIWLGQDLVCGWTADGVCRIEDVVWKECWGTAVNNYFQKKVAKSCLRSVNVTRWHVMTRFISMWCHIWILLRPFPVCLSPSLCAHIYSILIQTKSRCSCSHLHVFLFLCQTETWHDMLTSSHWFYNHIIIWQNHQKHE